MEKTTTIHLGGFAFTIEEGAYQNLKRYLESVRENISLEADKKEVMTDIEMSIAEKLKKKTSSSKEVVTAKDVEELILIMGLPEDFKEADNLEEKSEGEKIGKIKKKLYRNPDDMIIGGVCSGIATYFDIEPVLIRLVAFLLVFCNGIGIPAYIIFWIIIPSAETKSQKLEMQGSPLTVAAIEQSFKETEEKGNRPATVLGNIFRQIGKIIKRLLILFVKVFLFFLNFSIIALSIFTIIGMTVLVGVAIMYANSGYVIDYIPISEIIKTIPFYLLLLSTFFAIIIPAFLLLAADMAAAFNKKIVNFTAVIILITVWMIASVATTVMVVRYAPDLRLKISDIQYRQTIEVPSIENFNSISASGKNLIISIKLGDRFSVSANGMASDLDQITYGVDENKILNIGVKRKEVDRKCLLCDQKIVRIAITAPNVENIKITDADLVIENLISDKMTIVANGSDNINIDGNIKDFGLKIVNTYARLSGKFDNLIIEADKTDLSYDINSTTANIKLSNSTEANGSGSINQGNIEIDKNSHLTGLELNISDSSITLKDNSWAIMNIESSLSTNIDEDSGLFYIGDVQLNKTTNSPFATLTKISRASVSEYRKNENKDNYFQFYGNNYKFDIDNVDSELFQEKKELLREKF
ncbi:MAG: PspC domain-containing protein [Candidatus Paceibacterota bacterium]|jgi:phage shock protein PspC (stress-responsive transcriptional regulator)|nr:PspC domain-containing protein [bacterium]